MKKDPICGMNVDEKKAYRLMTQNAEAIYFCSQHCLEKFAKQENINLKEIAISCYPKEAGWYLNKTVWVAGVLLALGGLSYYFPILIPFRNTLLMYVHTIWWAILLGLILGGIIDHFVPREYISHVLARPSKRTILHAVTLGFFMSACNHGILALSMELYKKGASTSSVIAFLLASPWANFSLSLMLFGLFGLLKTIYIILGAVVIAIVTGLIYQILEREKWVEKNEGSLAFNENYSILSDFKIRYQNYHLTRQQILDDLKGVYKGMISLGNMVLWWTFLGIGLASFFGAYVPEKFFHQYMGPTVRGMMVTLFVATVLEVCSDGMSPLAFELYRQTKALGNSFVFLMSGVVTDYTEIGLIWQNIGKKAAIWLPIITVPQVIVLGVIANLIF